MLVALVPGKLKGYWRLRLGLRLYVVTYRSAYTLFSSNGSKEQMKFVPRRF